MYLIALELLAAFLGMIFILAYVERAERSAGLSASRDRKNPNSPPHETSMQGGGVQK